MESKELIFDAVSALSARHIEEAAGYELKKEGRPLPRRMAYAVAACLALFAAAFGISRIIRPAENDPNGAVAALPSATTAETAAPTEAPRIVYYNGPETVGDSDLPMRTVKMTRALTEALENEENEGCLFAVIIEVYADDCDMMREFEQKRIEAIHKLYTEPEIIAEFMARATELAYEGAERKGDGSFREEIDRRVEALGYYYNEYYMKAAYNEWMETRSAEEKEELLEAIENIKYQRRYGVAGGVIDGKTRQTFCDELRREEEARIASLGYEYGEYGNMKQYYYLTREQIAGFPFRSDYGYYLLLKGEQLRPQLNSDDSGPVDLYDQAVDDPLSQHVEDCGGGSPE